MFTLTMLPANDGDCLLLEYGNGERRHRVLVDGGRMAAHRAVLALAKGLPEDERRFELLVVTHVDEDHIKGALALAEDRSPALRFTDVWFNGHAHLVQARDGVIPGPEAFGAVQGERLSQAILDRNWPWNAAMSGGPVMVGTVPDRTGVKLDGGLSLTLLSPDAERLRRLEPQWRAEVFRAGLDPLRPAVPRAPPEGVERFGAKDVERDAVSRERPDMAPANGSSIAFLAEYDGARVLCLADAHPGLLEQTIRPLAEAEGGRLRVDLVKVSHHGSAFNTTRALLDMLDCVDFAISTDGSRHGHPDDETIARILKTDHGGRRRRLHFNYRHPGAMAWDRSELKGTYGYDCVFPLREQDGTLSVDVREATCPPSPVTSKGRTSVGKSRP